MLNTSKTQNKFKSKVFKALADPARLEILELLRQGEKCVCEIIPQVGLIQPVVSRHLLILKQAGLVKSRKSGNRRLYSVTDNRVYQITDSLTPELLETLKAHVIQHTV
jgi:ArsR family transcriptional regulator